MVLIKPLRPIATRFIEEETHMSKQTARGLALIAAIAGSLATLSAAAAGECPAGHMKANARTMVDYKPVGVTDTTLGAINLEKQPAHIVGPRAALPQAHHRARRHRALAQP